MKIILNEKESEEYLELKRRLKELCAEHNNLCGKILEIPLFNKYIDDLKEHVLYFHYEDLEELKKHE